MLHSRAVGSCPRGAARHGPGCPAGSDPSLRKGDERSVCDGVYIYFFLSTGDGKPVCCVSFNVFVSSFGCDSE